MALGWNVQDRRADRNKNDALNRKMRLVSLPKPRDLRLCVLHTKEWKKGYRRGKEISEREKKTNRNRTDIYMVIFLIICCAIA